MRHLLMAHQQESFLPFSSWQSLFCCLSCVAKSSTPKPRGPLYSPSELCGPSYLLQILMALSLLLQNLMALFLSPQNPVVLSFFTSEPHGPLPFPSEPHGSLPLWLPRLGLNPSTHLPLQPHFRLLLQSVTPASIPYSSSFTGLP